MVLVSDVQAKDKANLTVIQGGKAQLPIIISKEAMSTEKKAANFLKDYLDQISGDSFQILNEPLTKSGIYIGKTINLNKLGWDLESLDEDGFIVRTHGDNLYLVGEKEHGTEYAVYYFLEKYCGVRWYIPGELGTVIPKLSKLSISQVNDKVEPAYISRFFHGIDMAPGAKEWFERNRFRKRFPSGHNMFRIFRVNNITYETHPDYFPLINRKRKNCMMKGKKYVSGGGWQPCLSNPEVLSLTVKTARNWFDNPDKYRGGLSATKHGFSVCANDGAGHCECENCRKMEIPGCRVRYGRQITFAKRVAKELLKSHPDKLIAVGGYGHDIPSADYKLDLPPNIYIVVSSDRGQYRDPYFRKEDEERLQRLTKICKNVCIYEYFYGTGFVIPRIYNRLFADVLKKAHEMGIGSITGEAFPSWGLDGPKLWVTAKLLWDPYQDVEQLLNDFYEKFFENAAEPMRAYFDLCEKTWMQQKGAGRCNFKWLSDPGQVRIFPLSVVLECREYLDKAYAMDVSLTVKKRIDLYRKTFKVTEYHVKLFQPVDTAHRKTDVDIIDVIEEKFCQEQELQRYIKQVICKDTMTLHKRFWMYKNLDKFKSYALYTGVSSGTKALLDRTRRRNKGDLAKAHVEITNTLKSYCKSHPDARGIAKIMVNMGEYFPLLVNAIKTRVSLKIDGEPKDGIWQRTERTGDFIPLGKGETPAHQTRFSACYDTKRIYLFVEADCVKENLKMQKRKNDGAVWEDDSIEIKFDCQSDFISFYHIIVNPLGSIYTAKNGYIGWNPDIECKTSITDKTWSVEIAIPFEDLKVIPVDGSFQGGKSWRMNIGRTTTSPRKFSSWVKTNRAFNSAADCGIIYFVAD